MSWWVIALHDAPLSPHLARDSVSSVNEAQIVLDSCSSKPVVLAMPCALDMIDAMRIVLDKPTPFVACEREVSMWVGAFSGSERRTLCTRHSYGTSKHR
jgi:hypothetical protein